MNPFIHESLISHVRSINPRMEAHGETNVLAADVSLRLMMGETGDEWDAVLRDLLGVDEDYDVEGWVTTIGTRVDRLTFGAKYEDHSCALRPIQAQLVGTDYIGFQAKVNDFKMDFVDLGITFRLQLEAQGETVGQLAELIKQKVVLTTTAPTVVEETPEAEAETEG